MGFHASISHSTPLTSQYWSLSLGSENELAPVRVLRVTDFGKECWEGRDARARGRRRGSEKALDNALSQMSAYRFRDIISRALRNIFADKCALKNPSRQQPSPFDLFCGRRVNHLEMPPLNEARLEYDTDLGGFLLGAISRDNSMADLLLYGPRIV